MPVRYWLDVFFHTHPVADGLRRIEWPAGGHYLEQPNLAIEVFDIIRDEAFERLHEKGKQGSNR